jgi:hypothetical protein
VTKSQHKGTNEILEEATKEAAKSGRHICEILAAKLANAKAQTDRATVRKVEEAQKYAGCRNIRKRRTTP